jgi:ATP-dependent DNA ligase
VPVLRDDFREVPDTPRRWVPPTLVVEVEYRQRLKDGLRHAALKGLRPEKKPGLIHHSPSTNVDCSDRFFAATSREGLRLTARA